MIDATTYDRYAKNRPLEYEKQLLYSDIIVINKIDRIQPNQVCMIEKDLRHNYPDAVILHSSTKNFVPIHDLIMVHKFRVEQLRNMIEKFSDLQEGTHLASHTSHVNTVQLQINKPVLIDRYIRWSEFFSKNIT